MMACWPSLITGNNRPRAEGAAQELITEKATVPAASQPDVHEVATSHSSLPAATCYTCAVRFVAPALLGKGRSIGFEHRPKRSLGLARGAAQTFRACLVTPINSLKLKPADRLRSSFFAP